MLSSMESSGISSLWAFTKNRSAEQSSMPPSTLSISRPRITSTPGGVSPTYIKRVSVGAPHCKRRGTWTTVSHTVVPPIPLSHSGSFTLVAGQAGSTWAGEIMDTSQKVSGPTVTRCPDGRKALNTPTLPEVAGPEHAIPREVGEVRTGNSGREAP